MKLHKHHVIPRHMGGSDDTSNIITLTVDEHIGAHMFLYIMFGKVEDLTACCLLSGFLKEGYELRSKLGGQIQGKKNAEAGHIQKISAEQTFEFRSDRGKRSAQTCKELQVNAFFDPILRTSIASIGGSVQGKKNVESGHLQEINSQYWKDVKSGYKLRSKKQWFYSSETNESILVKVGDNPPHGFVKGRKLK